MCTKLFDTTITPLHTMIKQFYGCSLEILPFLASIVIVWGGYMYITSLGNEEKVREAKNWIIAGISGLIIILFIPLILKTLGLK